MILGFTVLLITAPGRSYAERTMAVSTLNFEAWDIYLFRKAKFSDGCTHEVKLVPEKLNCRSYTKDPRSVPGEQVSGPPILSTSRTSNVLFEAKAMTRETSRGKFQLLFEQSGS